MEVFKRLGLLLLITAIHYGCDPPNPEFNPNTYRFSIKGVLSDSSAMINLGDTIKFEVRMPDTITAINGLGVKIDVAVSSLQRAFYVYRIFRLDTANSIIYSTMPTTDGSFIAYLSRGNVYTTPAPYMQTTTKPYNSILNLVPKSRGTYYLEIVPQMGSFKVNNSFEGLFSVNFQTSDKHLNLISDNISNRQEWLLDAARRDAEGFGLYAFKVK